MATISSTKGNDGRGARRRLHQRMTAVFSFITTLLLMAFFWEPDERTGAAARHLRSTLRNRMESIRNRVQRQGGLTKPQGHHPHSPSAQQDQRRAAKHRRQRGLGTDEEDLQMVLDGKFRREQKHS